MSGSERFTRLPAYLAERARTVRFGDVPALVAHPDWKTPAPVMLWLHGRTARKELDAGRYLRWVRAGIGACAIDLPGHGERFEEGLQGADATMSVLRQAVGEIDGVVEALRAGAYGAVFDAARFGAGGMSAGGMAALRRLCDEHPFRCAAVEGTTGSFDAMPGYAERHDPAMLEQLDPLRHVEGWRPIPVLALHSEADRMVPVSGIRAFVERLRARYAEVGADIGLIEFKTWPETGAPEEHLGFGRYSNDAKNLQTEFLRDRLLG